MVRIPLLLAAILLGMLVTLTAAVGDDGADSWSRGTSALSTGQFERAIAAWSDALVRARTAW